MYQAISEVLQRLESPLSAAEMHGLLSGFVCAAHDNSAATWADDVIARSTPPDAATAVQCRKVLLSLQAYTLNQLQHDNFEYSPLLPNDNHALALRTHALGQWCQGFSYGLGLGGLKNMHTLSAPVREFIEDVLHFTRLDDSNNLNTDDAAQESEEKAYMEVREYLRVGVMTVYEERPLTP
jgi:uncharacterized protein